MEKVKPWQMVIMVLAVVAVGASAYFSFGGRQSVKLANEVLMVDVNTGELFAFPVGRTHVVIAPETNPETGSKSLLSVNKDSSGKWLIDGRELAAHLARIQGDHKAVTDAKTGEVRISNEKPKPGR